MSQNAGGGGELRGLSQWVQLYKGGHINFVDLTPYLTYDYGSHGNTVLYILFQNLDFKLSQLEMKLSFPVKYS
jgi:hypothetical protein